MEITQDEFLPNVTGAPIVICHFFHKDFQRCTIIHHHLRAIAPIHTEAKFVNIDAEKSPFFVGKLQIRVLPTIVMFKDGVAFDRIVGFEGVSEGDQFPTLALIRRLVRAGALVPRTQEEERISINRGRQQQQDSESDSDDF